MGFIYISGVDLILKNVKIVTSTSIIEADLGISNGKIAKIGKIREKGATERNCEGLFILPGVIDMHVHFRDPGFPEKEDFFTGSCAAAIGGVTTVIDMPNTSPPTLTCAALAEKRKIAAEKSLVNYGFYMGLSHDNLDEIKKAKNIAGVKIYMGSTTGDLLMDDPDFIEKFFSLKKFAIIHAENEAVINENQKKYNHTADPSAHSLIRSPRAAFEAVKTALHLAKKCDAKVHVTHVSTALEVAGLHKFKNPLISADCTPHHLFLTQAAYLKQSNFVKINPPLRTAEDSDALKNALKQGVIQAVASDHAPHTKKEKEQMYSLAPSGVPGVETLLPLLLDAVNHGEFTLEEIAKFTAENPAKILNIKNKGKIAEGFDADLAIVDMGKEDMVGAHGYQSKCGWSPFEGKKLKGWPVATLVNGAAVYDKGKINIGRKGAEANFAV